MTPERTNDDKERQIRDEHETEDLVPVPESEEVATPVEESYATKLIRKADPEWQEGDPTWHLDFIMGGNVLQAVKLVGDINVVREQRASRRVQAEKEAAVRFLPSR